MVVILDMMRRREELVKVSAASTNKTVWNERTEESTSRVHVQEIPTDVLLGGAGCLFQLKGTVILFSPEIQEGRLLTLATAVTLQSMRR